MYQTLPTTVSKTKTRTSDISIMQKYFTTLSPYRNVTRAVGILASSANKDGAFGSHILHSPSQTLSRRTHLVDIREFLQMTCIQQHGIKVSQLEQKIHYNKIVNHIKCKAILKKLKHINKKQMTLTHKNKKGNAWYSDIWYWQKYLNTKIL